VTRKGICLTTYQTKNPEGFERNGPRRGRQTNDKAFKLSKDRINGFLGGWYVRVREEGEKEKEEWETMGVEAQRKWVG
jgi:hypothetical protein